MRDAAGWSTLTGDRVLNARRELPFLARIGYASTGESIMSADRMLASAGWSTLTGDRVLYHQKDGGSVIATGFPNEAVLYSESAKPYF